MTPICTCGHSKTDHLTGRCVNRTTRFDAASGGTVAVQCSCKKFAEPEEKKKRAKAAPAGGFPATDAGAAESVGTAPAALDEPSNETTAEE